MLLDKDGKEIKKRQTILKRWILQSKKLKTVALSGAAFIAAVATLFVNIDTITSFIRKNISIGNTTISFSDSSDLQNEFSVSLKKWINVATDARVKNLIHVDEPLPLSVGNTLSQFKSAWADTPLSIKRQFDDQEVYKALSLAIKIHSEKEKNSPNSPDTLLWADFSINYFRDVGNSVLLVEAYSDLAEQYYRLSQLNNQNPAKFSEWSEKGNALMQKAFESSKSDDQKAGVLRAWSRLLYNLARPSNGELAQDWDTALLSESVRKAQESVKIMPESLLGYTQLSRSVQRLASQDINRKDSKWLEIMWETHKKLTEIWLKKNGEISDSEKRVPPLNILAVLGMDYIDRLLNSGKSLDQKDLIQLMELGSQCIAYEEEVVAILPNTQWSASFNFDTKYDLARLYVIRYLVAKRQNAENKNALWQEALDEFRKAFKGALTEAQRTSIKMDFKKAEGTGFRGLTRVERNRVIELL